jgi:hypothetical protein
MAHIKKRDKKLFKLRTVVVNTDQARFVMETFPYLSSALYFLYVKAPYFAYDEEATRNNKGFNLTVNDLEGAEGQYAYLGNVFIRTAKMLSKEVSRLTIIMNEKGSELGSLNYKENSEKCKIYAPIANNFLELVLELDKLVMITDLLWFDGHIDSKERNSNVVFYKNKVKNNFMKIISQSNNLKDKIYAVPKK